MELAPRDPGCPRRLTWRRRRFRKRHPRGPYRMDTDNTVREEDHQLRKAELSNQWRGGLQLGDNVDLGGQRMRVVGNNRDGTKPILSDAVDANAGERAYKQYKQHLSG